MLFSFYWICKLVYSSNDIIDAEQSVIIAEQLQHTILAIYSDFLSDDGHAVDYEGIAQRSFKKLNKQTN